MPRRVVLIPVSVPSPKAAPATATRPFLTSLDVSSQIKSQVCERLFNQLITNGGVAGAGASSRCPGFVVLIPVSVASPKAAPATATQGRRGLRFGGGFAP